LSSSTEERLSQMMVQSQLGDRCVYEALLSEASLLLKRFVRKRVFDPILLEDVVQEVLISLHKARHTYDPTRKFLPWMYAMAAFRVTDFLRKLGRTRTREIGDLDFDKIMSIEPVSDPRIGSEQYSEKMNEALTALSPKQKKIIELLKVDELSIKEIANRLGMSESAVKVTAHRGYKSLRQAFGVTDHEHE